jgi:hypothetical protein
MSTRPLPAPRRRILAKLGGLLARAMPARLTALLLVLGLCLTPVAAAAQGYSHAAAEVVARAFAATGGSGWYLLRGWHETGRSDGLAYERWIDPVRYGMRTETHGPHGLSIEGFNGQAVWAVRPGGVIDAVNDHPALAEARTTAFFTSGGYFFQGRFGARGDYLGVRAWRGRRYQVVRITPWNGEPRELWFDASSHLLGRIVDRTGPRVVAIDVSDYRKVGPVRVAFRYTAEGGGPAGPLARQLESLSFTPVDRGEFSLDRPAALAKVARSVAAAP